MHNERSNFSAPYFSVIVPCYRCIDTIETTIASVLSQTCQDFEILLVNDGSPDDTLTTLQGLAASDKRVRVFSKANGGVSSARNLGVREARGEVLAFLDSDDVWVPRKLACHRELFESNADVSVSYAQIRFLGSMSQPCSRKTLPAQRPMFLRGARRLIVSDCSTKRWPLMKIRNGCSGPM